MDLSKKKVKIDYPIKWNYKVIGYDIDLLKQAIYSIVKDYDHNINHSNSSKENNYHSMNVDVEVPDEKTRLVIYSELKEHTDIKLVL